ncbi:hypothetical protein TEA_022465 [Camellia sinensis var. sinensis]|uniref:Major facilitator superfamily (MFS) profile domain-containing protein n=1 Tax=Camellia sinensis var. sinensis TaxID=542762 RepID=A0A4S4E0S2_CAMSN|nr:hypothetical protein TEA_022465 [Camellia sinensis var. sinensis]
MSFREESDDGRDLKKPFLHTGSWYRMGSRQSSMMSSSQAIRDRSISVLACVLIVALGPIQFGFTAGYSSPTQTAITDELGLTVSESLMIAAIPNILGWLAISFAKDSSFLYMGRLLEGFGVGIISYTVPVYIAEIAPQNLRGGLGILPCLILIPGLFFIPESPRWLAKMGMTEDFEASLQVLRGFDTDISIEVNEIKICSINQQKNCDPFLRPQTKKILVSPDGSTRCLKVGIGLLCLQQLSGTNGVLFYSSTIFSAAGISSSNVATFGLGAIQVAATGIATWLVDKTGRRILLIVSSSTMTVSLLVVAISFFIKDSISSDSTLYSILGILSLVGVVTFFFSPGHDSWIFSWNGANSVGDNVRAYSNSVAHSYVLLCIMPLQILPINIKGLAGSVATLANWFFAWVVTMTANLLLSWSSGGTFTIYMVMSAFTVVFVYLWVPETKGRTLEEIQISLR